MPYGFNDDRSKYPLDEGGGGGCDCPKPLVLHPNEEDADLLDKLTGEIIDAYKSGANVVFVIKGEDIPYSACYTLANSYFHNSEYWVFNFIGMEGELLSYQGDALDEYPYLQIPSPSPM